MIQGALVLLAVGGAGFLVRLVRGPSVADRVVSLDGLLTLVSTGIAGYGALRGEGTYLMVGVVVSLVAFLATATFARFIEGPSDAEPPAGPGRRNAGGAAEDDLTPPVEGGPRWS